MSANIGPAAGSLVVVGGGYLRDSTILNRFLALAGGFNAPVVIIPTAYEDDYYGPYTPYHEDFMRAGAQNLSVRHTRDRNLANSADFTQAIHEANGVWFTGGRHWRLADAYLNTKTHEALQALLERGGVIGGTSAGATILGSFMVRGDTDGNEMMIGDHTEGLGFLKNVTIDQHHLKRNRHFDMQAVLAKRPELLGIGIDEDTAIVVRGDEFEVIGSSYVAIYDGHKKVGADGSFYFLAAGDQFNLQSRAAIPGSTDREGSFAGITARS